MIFDAFKLVFQIRASATQSSKKIAFTKIDLYFWRNRILLGFVLYNARKIFFFWHQQSHKAGSCFWVPSPLQRAIEQMCFILKIDRINFSYLTSMNHV